MGPMHISKKLHLVLLARFVVEIKANKIYFNMQLIDDTVLKITPLQIIYLPLFLDIKYNILRSGNYRLSFLIY